MITAVTDKAAPLFFGGDKTDFGWSMDRHSITLDNIMIDIKV